MRALVVIVLGIALSTLDGTIVNLALPGITRDLQASAAASIWVISAYQIAMLGLLLPLATLGDIVGYRKVYLVGMVVFTAASLACALAGSVPALAAARALQGMGAAGVLSVNAAIVRQIYPRALLGRGIAVNSLVVAVSSVAGPSVAAAILSVASWPWLFLINVPLGILTFVLGRQALPRIEPARAGLRRPSPVDVALNVLMFGLVFLGADTLGTLYGADGAQGGGPSRRTLALALAELGAGLLIGALYVRRQRAQPMPIFPLDLLRLPVFALSMCSSVCAFCAQTLAYVGLPFLLLEAYGRSHLQAGALLTAWPLGVVVAALVMGRLIGRVPGGLLGAGGMLLMGIGMLLLAMLPAAPADAAMVWRMALCGVGFGMFQSPNNHIILTTGPAHRSGAASGMLGSARLTGQTLGALILATVFSFHSPLEARGPVMALFIGVGFCLLAALASALRVGRMSEKQARPAKQK